MPGQVGQQLGSDRAEESFQLAAALRPPDGGVDDLDVQVGGGRGEVVAGEVAAVVGVELWSGRPCTAQPGSVLCLL